MDFDCSALSDLGRRRSRNEDAYVMDPERGVFLVADGMGGEDAGDVASRIAAQTFTDAVTPYLLDEDMTLPFEGAGEDHYCQILRLAAERANDQVVRYAEEHGSMGMGSTLTAALVTPLQLYVLHVGDSRLYRITKKSITALTEDHTRVQEMVRQGLLKPEEARRHPNRNVITRCIGRKKIKPDTLVFDPDPSSVYLICSDGLYDMVTDDVLLATVLGSSGLDEASRRLVQSANDLGGKDNITVVLFRIRP